MSRHAEFLNSLYGSRDPDRLMRSDSPTSSVPWPQAGRLKSRESYDKDRVTAAISKPVKESDLQDVDPRTLSATQPSLVRSALDHYMGRQFTETGKTYADDGNVANKAPVVYKRENGENLLLSGHHRAAAALLEGRPLRARVVEGPWGPPRR